MAAISKIDVNSVGCMNGLLKCKKVEKMYIRRNTSLLKSLSLVDVF